MKILFIAPRYHTNQYHVVAALQSAGHKVYFHVTRKGNTEDYTLINPVVFDQSRISSLLEILIGKRNGTRPRSFPSPVQYWKVISDLNPDIIIIRDPESRYFSKLAAIFSLIKGVKVIFYTQEAIYRMRKRKTTYRQNIYINTFRAAWMTPILGEVKDNHKIHDMYYVPLPIYVRNGVETEKELSHEGVNIMFIGKYDMDRKNHLLLLDALYELKNNYSFNATFIGECYSEKQTNKFNSLKEKRDQLGLTKQVNLKINIPYSKMGSYYSSHNLFVLPAVNEQYGISVTEALGYGLPVICTDTCGARYHIRNGYNGFVIKSNSLKDLVNALEACFATRTLLKEMSHNALSYASENLSMNSFMKYFDEMISKRFNMSIHICQK